MNPQYIVLLITWFCSGSSNIHYTFAFLLDLSTFRYTILNLNGRLLKRWILN